MSHTEAMDIGLVEAIISGTVSLAVGVIGALVHKDRVSGKKREQLRRDQLALLYEPIMAFFLFRADTLLSREEVLAISELLAKHNSIAAPALVLTWQEYLKNGKNDSSKFENALFSNYNWVKKSLGYPYDREKIKLEYVPKSDYSKGLYWSALILSVLLFFIFWRVTEGTTSFLTKILSLLIFLVSYTGFYISARALIKNATRL